MKKNNKLIILIFLLILSISFIIYKNVLKHQQIVKKK